MVTLCRRNARRFGARAFQPSDDYDGDQADDEPGEDLAQIMPADGQRADAHADVDDDGQRRQDRQTPEEICDDDRARTCNDEKLTIPRMSSIRIADRT